MVVDILTRATLSIFTTTTVTVTVTAVTANTITAAAAATTAANNKSSIHGWGAEQVPGEGLLETAAAMREEGIRKGQRVEVTTSNCCRDWLQNLKPDLEAEEDNICMHPPQMCLRGQPPGLDTLAQNHFLSVLLSGPVPSVEELGECWRNTGTWPSPEFNPSPLLWETTLGTEPNYTFLSLYYFPVEKSQKNVWARYKYLIISVVLLPRPCYCLGAFPASLNVQKGIGAFPRRHWVLISNSLRKYVVDIFRTRHHLIWWLRTFLWKSDKIWLHNLALLLFSCGAFYNFPNFSELHFPYL